MRLLPGVYQVGGPACSQATDASAYLLPAGDELLLIDCGTERGFHQIRQNIISLGFSPARVTRILGTHGHYDHLGAAALWQRETGARLWLHRDDARQVAEGDSIRTTAAFLYGATMPPVRVDQFLEEGQKIQTDAGILRVLHTPGHTPGSCCLALDHPSGLSLLIAGDTLHGGFSSLIGSDEASWRLSLRKLQAEHFDCYTFGHLGPQLLFDADRRIAELARSFANYYNPWFKDFYTPYSY
ncbi:MAG: MBL fold metallo-hydrolase [Christensenellales bacterium]